MAESVTYCRPEDLGDVLAEDMEQHVADQRRMLTRVIGQVQERAVGEAPRFAGDFAASIRPYRGEPGRTWKRGGGGNDAGASDVEAMMAAWEPGDFVGIATDAPYSRKLIFHAGEDRGRVSRRNRRGGRSVFTGARRSYTKKVGAGWLERIVDQANRDMESA